MQLDGLTLMVPGIFASAVSGIILLGAWFQRRNTAALLWWACASAVHSLGVAGVVAGIASKQLQVTTIGAALAGFAPVIMWCSIRSFNHRSKPLIVIAAMPIIWFMAAFAPVDIDHQKWATMIPFASWCIFQVAMIRELWIARAEKLNARWPLMALLAINIIPFLGAIVQLFAGTFPDNEPPALDTWFGIIQFENILFSTGTAFFLALMCKERSELRHIEAAKLDALTGVFNHGAFMEAAHSILLRCQIDGSPCALIMFDLDHFKKINDTLGHQAGDRVLRAFVCTARSALRSTDLFGRYGGEEFMVILPDTTIQAATDIAERVRHTFAEAHMALGDGRLRATVSAGVAAAPPLTVLDTMIEAADSAMYKAKQSGRNRVEKVGGAQPKHDEVEKVIRIA